MAGWDQLACEAMRWGVTLSMWETVTPKALLKGAPMRVSVRLVARLAAYSREPLAHENPPAPGAGPNATAGSPRERSPASY
jgi:hypothetical protein